MERDLNYSSKIEIEKKELQKSDRPALKTGGATHTNHNRANAFLAAVMLLFAKRKFCLLRKKSLL